MATADVDEGVPHKSRVVISAKIASLLQTSYDQSVKMFSELDICRNKVNHLIIAMISVCLAPSFDNESDIHSVCSLSIDNQHSL